MLSREEQQEIEAELTHYPYKRGACIEALKIVQRHRGWVSDESLHDLAPLLEMSVHELDNVATFYNLIFRQPVGEHVILLCDSVSCWLMGYEQIRAQLQQELGIGMGQTTEDGRFTLLPMPCLGDCDHAPALMIDEELHHDLDGEKVTRLLGQYD
ncbi:MAG: NADH-quinone oxidoreductase subunit NuoE [Anaerolineaceae bacterium]|nr:NADH-quinone oxidoreductase subunit NuoE [Anaerolineaceae bacterium]